MIHLPLSRKLTGAAIVIAIAASTAFSQTPAPTSNPVFEAGIKLLRDGETKKALDSFKRALKENKADGEAWYYVGIAHLQLGELKKGADAFEKAIELRPDLAAQVHGGYAYALVLRNRLNEATISANKALEVDPKNTEALHTLAIVDLRRGALEEAVKKADTLIALKPAFAAAYLLKSQAFVSTGNTVPPNSIAKEERQLRYRSAADALEKYLQVENDPVLLETWREQLETLKFLLEDKGGIYMGREVTTKATLISKPEPVYTQRARNDQVTGTVVLRCVFASDGTVKHILIVEALPSGLTEQSVAAAKMIQFTPATLNGIPVSMWMQLEYNYSLY